jgi:mRNA interferase RelE/StbE
MAYNLVYTNSTCRDIDKLDCSVKSRLKLALERLALDPWHNIEALRNSSLGSYRMRLGNYRVIFDIEGPDIVILRVGHRREIYRGR